MTKRSCEAWTIVLSPTAWQLLPPAGSTCAPSEACQYEAARLEALAEPIVSALTETGWRGQAIVLAIADQGCLTATLCVAPRLARKRSAMRYEFETVVPWAAEEFVCDYVVHREGACFSAVLIEPLKRLLMALDALDAAVAIVSPASVLALQGAQLLRETPEYGALIWARYGSAVSWFWLRDARLWKWSELGGNQLHRLALEAQMDMLTVRDRPAICVTLGLSEAETAAVSAAGLVVQPLADLDWTDAIRCAAAELAAARIEPIFNFRRDELGSARSFDALRGDVWWLKAACLMLLAATCAAFWFRAANYQQARAQLDERLERLFEETFSAPSPPNAEVLAKFGDEQRRLAATRGQAGALPQITDADAILQQTLAALPDDLRYRAIEVRIESNDAFIMGEVRSNADADRLASGLRDAGAVVEPPRLLRLPQQGFSVRLAAEFGAEATQ